MDHARLTADDPDRLKVLEERSDGSGLVEIPILTEHQEFDFSRTVGGGPEKGAITVEMMREMVANFAEYPGPVPCGMSPHVEDRSGPSSGFVEKLVLRGKKLWAVLDLSAWLFGVVVRERAYRGFSIEARKDMQHPARKFEGWVLVGGVFTNQPSTDVHFKVAADARSTWGGSAAVHTGLDVRPEDTDMADDKVISLATHEAKVNELKAQLTTTGEQARVVQAQLESQAADLAKIRSERDELRVNLASASTERDSLKALGAQKENQLGALQKSNTNLQIKITELESEMRAEKDKFTATEVRDVVGKALHAGIPPAVFDGWETDPASWLKGNYASLESFKRHVENLATIGGKFKLSLSKTPAQSGNDPGANAADQDEKTKPTAEEAAVLERFGGSTFAGVTTEEEARKRFLALKAKRAAS